jgi:hypothetical protein
MNQITGRNGSIIAEPVTTLCESLYEDTFTSKT